MFQLTHLAFYFTESHTRIRVVKALRLLDWRDEHDDFARGDIGEVLDLMLEQPSAAPDLQECRSNSVALFAAFVTLRELVNRFLPTMDRPAWDFFSSHG